MSGVAGQEGASAAHRLGHARAKLVDGVASQLSVVRTEPRGQELPDSRRIREVLGALVGKQHELPASMALPVAGVHVRAARIAPLARSREMLERADVMRPQVEREPICGEAEVLPFDSQRLPDRRLRAVGADHVARAHGSRFLRRSDAAALVFSDALQQQLCVVGMLDDLGCAPAPLDRCAASGRRDPGPSPDKAGRRDSSVPIRTAAGACGVHAHDRLAVGAEPAVFPDRKQIVGDLFDDAERLPDAHDLVIEVDRAGQVIEVAEPLEDTDPVAGAADQRGCRLTDRPVADYCHVVVELGHWRGPFLEQIGPHITHRSRPAHRERRGGELICESSASITR